MYNRLNQPKSFGEILDQTFRICKQQFRVFFVILLCIIGPIYVLEAIIQLASGKSFFRDLSGEGSWLEQMVNSFDLEAQASTNIAADAGLTLASFLLLLAYPIVHAAIILGVQQLNSNENPSAKELMKKAFSRFWPTIGSTLLYYVIFFGMLIGFFIILGVSSLIFFIGDFILGIIVAIIFGLGLFLFGAYFLTRWSFFFGSSVIDHESPGLGRSWSLSKGQTFKMMGLYFIIFLITTAISLAIEASFSIFLGYSALLTLIIGFTNLFTTLIFAVGYSVMYLDLKVRHDADDLKEMIDDYHTN